MKYISSYLIFSQFKVVFLLLMNEQDEDKDNDKFRKSL